MGYVKDISVIAGATVVILFWLVCVVAGALLPAAIVWYLVTH